jgi:hypothetical protein
VAAVVVALVIGVTTSALLVGSGDNQAGPQPVGPHTPPAGAARAACLVLVRVQALVTGNAAAREVLHDVEVAVEDMAVAGAAPTWLSLQSGVTALQQGLTRDSSSATQLGIDIVRYQCERTGVQLSAAPAG